MASGFGAGVGVDTRALKAFIVALREAQPAAAKSLHKQLVVAGEVVAKEARSISSKHSTSIPGTIRTQVRNASVAVVAGGPRTGAAGKALAKAITNASYGTRSSNAKLARLEKRAGNVLPGLYEFGNKGGRASATGTFRHPVMGNREQWVEQPRYAFLRPAVQHEMPALEAALGHAVDDIVRVLRK